MSSDSYALARRAAELVLEKQAQDVVLLDLRELSSACDYFVLATGQSEQQVRAIAEHLELELKQEETRPWHVEGRSHRRWILLDFVDVVVHIFHSESRDFYLLEKLWSDAPREDIHPEVPSTTGEEES